jgi:DNA-binding SARP family transcriptional activator
MLEIALLGRFDLRLDDEPLDLASRPQKKLLTYLALNAGLAVPRAKLAGILWLDAPERTARKNLRHHLWRLRQAIGEEYLLTTSDTAAFNSATTYRLDVEVLERSPLDSDLEALIEAISVYRGELLPGFYDDWILLERERLLAAFERRMQTLIDRLTAEKRWPDLIVWAEHWITHAFAPEPAYRALMIGFAALGDRASVVKHYQRCQKALQEELGVEPSAETQALFERLTSGEPLEEIEAIHTSRRIGQSDSFLPEGTVTFLFTDIQGSTELLQALGDQYLALLADHHRILREVFARWHGREVGAEGDSFFVSFPRAAGALAATVEAQRALTTHDWPAGAQVRVRMGLHTGEPWTVEENYAGIDVHRAARIANAGHGGQVLLSETSAALVLDQLPEDVALLDLGWHQLKDMKRAEHIRQLVIEGLPSDFPALKSLAVACRPI